MDVNKT